MKYFLAISTMMTGVTTLLYSFFFLFGIIHKKYYYCLVYEKGLLNAGLFCLSSLERSANEVHEIV